MSGKRITVYVVATMDTTELNEFWRAIRKWDNARPEVQVAVSADTGDMTQEEVKQAFLGCDPPLPVTATSRKGHPDWDSLKSITKQIERISKKQ